MTNCMTSAEESQVRLVLPAVLDLTAAPSLKAELMQASNGAAAIAVDAGQVQRISSLCIQLLLAAGQQVELRISPCSDAFKETARGLGLSPALGLTGDSDG